MTQAKVGGSPEAGLEKTDLIRKVIGKRSADGHVLAGGVTGELPEIADQVRLVVIPAFVGQDGERHRRMGLQGVQSLVEADNTHKFLGARADILVEKPHELLVAEADFPGQGRNGYFTARGVDQRHRCRHPVVIPGLERPQAAQQERLDQADALSVVRRIKDLFLQLFQRTDAEVLRPNGKPRQLVHRHTEKSPRPERPEHNSDHIDRPAGNQVRKSGGLPANRNVRNRSTTAHQRMPPVEHQFHTSRRDQPLGLPHVIAHQHPVMPDVRRQGGRRRYDLKLFHPGKDKRFIPEGIGKKGHFQADRPFLCTLSGLNHQIVHMNGTARGGADQQDIADGDDPYPADKHQKDQHDLASCGEHREYAGRKTGRSQRRGNLEDDFQETRPPGFEQNDKINPGKKEEGVEKAGRDGRFHAVGRDDIPEQGNVLMQTELIFRIGINGRQGGRLQTAPGARRRSADIHGKRQDQQRKRSHQPDVHRIETDRGHGRHRLEQGDHQAVAGSEHGQGRFPKIQVQGAPKRQQEGDADDDFRGEGDPVVASGHLVPQVRHHNESHRPHIRKQQDHDIHVIVRLEADQVVRPDAEPRRAESGNTVENSRPERIRHIMNQEIRI